MYDVVIIGAGPSGSTLARLLQGRCRVLLADRRPITTSVPLASDASAGKLCGGLLAPAAQKELARQGLGVPSSVLAGPQLFAVRAKDDDSGLERRYQRHYLNIDRQAFDQWLVSLAEPFCDYRPGWTFEAIDQREPNPLVRFTTAEGGAASVAARCVVGADGAASALRRCASPGVAASAYVAVQAAFTERSSEGCYGAFFSPGLTDYYAWSIPKDGYVLAGAAFPRSPHVTARFNEIVSHMREAGFGLGEEIFRASAPLVRPLAPRDVRLGSDRVAFLGEAAGLISPSSAEGISYALRSAAAFAAAFEVAPDDTVYEYRRFARPLVAEVVGKMVKSRLLQVPAVRRTALLTGLGSLPEGEVDGFAGMLGELLTP